MKINRSERNRVFVIFIIFFLWVIIIGASLVKIQVFDYNKNIAKVRAQSNRTFTMHPKRGTIYDSSGEVLAISVKAKSAFLSNKDKKDSLQLFNRILKLKKRFPLSKGDKKNIKNRIRKGDKFIWVKRKLSDKEYKLLKKIKATNKTHAILDFVEEYKRIYPQSSTACHILGGVGIDEQGLYGIEYGIDSTIRGKDGEAEVVLDARHKIFNLQYLTEPAAGKDIHLTINLAAQFFVERELEKAIKKHKAKGGAVVILDVSDGAIIAAASYPNYHPGNIKWSSNDRKRNRAISFLYHPGSTFKIISAATALESRVCSPRQTFDCHNGVYQVKDQVITDVHPHDTLTFEKIIVYSSNIGAAKIGERLGRKRLYEGIKKFGFGTRVGLPLTGEEKGIFNPLNKWTGVSAAFHSYGYEIAVTPLQMARAFNVIASGGYLLEPHVVKKIDGVFLKPKKRQKILSPSTVRQMAAIMMEVVNRGTGKATRIKGIQIAGKTGTTKKIGKSKGKYVSSFGGFFPANKPAITMFVMVDEPIGLYYGADVAAPLFKAIAKKMMIYLNIIPGLDKKNEIRL